MTTRQTPDAVREAEILAQAREAAAQAFDARAKKAGHPDTVTLERHHAKVIRQGEGDDYDAVQSALIALRLAALDSRAGDAGEGFGAVLERWDSVIPLSHDERTKLIAELTAATPAPAVDAQERWEGERPIAAAYDDNRQYQVAMAAWEKRRPPAVDAMCPSSPDGRHQVDTSMESGPNNCFHCEAPMGGRHAR